jgi:hypothetical protein
MRRFEMRNRALVAQSGAALVVAALLWAPAPAAGQSEAEVAQQQKVADAARQASPRTGEEAEKFFEAEIAKAIAEASKKVYDPNKPNMANPPRTPWGDPDLRGYYLTATYTPLQRPNGVTKALQTPEEAVMAFKNATDADAGVDPATVHYDWKEFGIDGWQSPIRPNLRTSLIVDPPDGRVPPVTEDARKRAAARAAADKQRDDQTGVSIFGNLYTRCVRGGGNGPLVGGGNPGNDGAAGGVTTEIQLFQSPGYVTLYHQRNSEIRIIPLDGRAPLPKRLDAWQGYSVGRWEGNTLVVETTNFNDPAPAQNYRGATQDLKFVERFSVVDADTLRYEITISDPNTWARPWTIEAPLPRIDPPLFEFACHEQNYGLINLVMGAQIRATEGALDPRDPRTGRLTAVPGR